MKWTLDKDHEWSKTNRIYIAENGAVVERIQNLSGARGQYAIHYDRRFTWQVARSSEDQWELQTFNTLVEAKAYAEEITR